MCRDIGISRQQFTKYLSGQSVPSLHNLRIISDYFGVDEAEILFPAEDFRDLVAIRPPEVKPRNPGRDFFLGKFGSASSRQEIQGYLGYYYTHFIMQSSPSRITRALISIYEHKGAIVTKNIERYPEDSDGAASVAKYEGVAFLNAERLFIYEREVTHGKLVWQSVVYASDMQASKYLSGLTMGIATDSVRNIACYRTVYSYIGRETNIRSALKGCGSYPLDSLEIPKYVRQRVRNDMNESEVAFMPR